MHKKLNIAEDFRHEIDDKILEAYRTGQFPKIVSKCMQEWSPKLPIDNTGKPDCPVCYPAEKKRYVSPFRKNGAYQNQYLPKPVVVEAMHLQAEAPNRIDDILAWGEAGGCKMEFYGVHRGLIMPSRFGTIVAHEGDWIIKNLEGTFFPMRSDVFWLLYDAMK